MTRSTITDIAKEMGISPSTVSRALSGSPRVKESTRAAIEKKAREVKYERNVMASNLRKGIVRTVGIIVPIINRQFFSSVISSAESVLGAAGYSVIICQTHEKQEDEIKVLKTMRANQVAGVLMSHSIESKDSRHILENISERMILVQFDRVFMDLEGTKVVNDGVSGGYQATKKLIENGYKKVGTLAGYLECECYASRNKGYLKALKEAGIQKDEGIIFKNSILRETGFQSAKEAIGKGCDALYCTGDFSALGAVDAAKEAGLRIPEDFGIIGTANENFTELMAPSLSSLEQNPREMGKQAAEAFLKRMKGEKTEEVITIPMQLIARRSSSKNG